MPYPSHRHSCPLKDERSPLSPPLLSLSLCGCVCARACVRACARACVRACVRACCPCACDYVTCDVAGCIGRLNTSMCDPNATSPLDDCVCSAASLNASASRIGRMSVFFPFPTISFPLKSSCAAMGVPPVEHSTYLGEWYSMPAHAECAPDATHLPGARGCTWTRRATHHFVHGEQLIRAGFELYHNFTPALLRHNRDVIEHVLAQHEARCCEC